LAQSKEALVRCLEAGSHHLVKAGSVLACKGATVHGGPSSEGPRVALFFTARVITEAPYDSDFQATAWSVPVSLADDALQMGHKGLSTVLMTAALNVAKDWLSDTCKPWQKYNKAGKLTAFGEKMKKHCLALN